MSNTTPPKFDRAEIKRGLAILTKPGSVFEVRAIGMGVGRAFGTLHGYFDGVEKASAAICTLWYPDASKSSGVYVIPAPVKRGLIYRANNEFSKGSATTDDDVLERRWFLLDVDPKRYVDGDEIKGIPASEEELAAAIERRDAIVGSLCADGWPWPVLGMSGNGAHAMFRVDEPNDEDTRALFSDALGALAAEWSDDVCDVDVSVFNAARIWKVPGTTGRKGSHTEERPWRMARFETVPENLEVTPRDLIEQLAARVRVEETPAPKRPRSTRSRGGEREALDVDGWLSDFGVASSKSKPHKGGTIWQIRDCPHHGDEHRDKVWVYQDGQGVVSAGCKGGRCQGAGWSWAWFRGHHEPAYAEACAERERRAHLRVVSGGRGTSTVVAAAEVEAAPAPPAGAVSTTVTREGGLTIVDTGAGTEGLDAARDNDSDEQRAISAVKERLFYHSEKSDRPDGSIANILTVLLCDPRWKGVLAFDLLQVDISTAKEPPWGPLEKGGEPWSPGMRWTDMDDTGLMSWLRREYGISAGPDSISRAVNKAAAALPFHPFRDYLEGLEWDGVERLDGWLTRGCGAVDTPYTRLVGSLWIKAVAARSYPPARKDEGVKVDNVLILEGRQGLFKSRAFAALLPQRRWVSDTHLPIGHKDAFQSLSGKVIYELAEIDGYTSKREAAVMKAFLSSDVDNYRPPFGRRNVEARRPCVFCGTANKAEYLIDETGNRRFWPVAATKIDLAWIEGHRDQLWAEANARRVAGERWWIDGDEERALCEEQQRARVIGDAWAEVIAEKLGLWLKGWRAQEPNKLRAWLKARCPTYGDVLGTYLGIPTERFKRGEMTERVRLAMASLGFELENFKRPVRSEQLDANGDAKPGTRRGDAGRSVRAFLPKGDTLDEWRVTLNELLPSLPTPTEGETPMDRILPTNDDDDDDLPF